MATLRDIKRRINAVANTSKITQAMRMVSAAKLRRAQEAIWSARPYVQKLNQILINLIENVGEDYSHPLIQKRKSINNIALIAVATDRGLCGSFNTNLFRYVTNYVKNDLHNDYPNANLHFVSVGKRSCNFFRKEYKNILKEFPNVFQSLQFTTAKDIVNTVADKFMDGKIDMVIVFYNEFKNLISQVPRHQVVLPIDPRISTKEKTQDKYQLDYIFEPDKKLILDELLPKNLDIQIWRALLESNAAEQAARMVAMENATNNAYDLIKHLELVYNKERQASITKEMLEIVSGANALKKS